MIRKLRNTIKGDVHLHELLRGSVITFILKMAGMLLAYVAILAISKRSGANGVGFYQLFIQTLTILSVFLVGGLNSGVLRYVGQFNNEKERSNMHILQRYIQQLILPLSCGLAILIFLFSDTLSHWIANPSFDANTLKILACALPFFTMNQVNVEFIRGLKKVQISELVRSVLRPLTITLAVLIFFRDELTHADIPFVVLAGILINAIVSRTSIWLALRKIPKQASDFKRKDLVKTSLPMYVTGISNTLIASLPFFFIEYFHSQKDVGIFTVSLRLASLVSMILIIINSMAAPKIAELYWSDQKQQLIKLINQSAVILLVLATASALLIGLGAAIWLDFFGKEFKSGLLALEILLIGQWLNAITGSVGIFLNMSGNQKVLRNTMVITAILCLIGYILIVPAYGIMGAAIVSSLTTGISNCVLVYIVYKKTGIITIYLPKFLRSRVTKDRELEDNR